MSVEENFKHLSEYLEYWIDIRFNEPKAWEGSRLNSLPTFEYYLKNCVQDKGGKYDFTVPRYSSQSQLLRQINVDYKPLIEVCNLKRRVLYSYWMGTAFNFHEVIERESFRGVLTKSITKI